VFTARYGLNIYINFKLIVIVGKLLITRKSCMVVKVSLLMCFLEYRVSRKLGRGDMQVYTFLVMTQNGGV